MTMEEKLDRIDTNKFWSRIYQRPANECWEWKGCYNSYGYGVYGIKNSSVQSHRISFYLTNKVKITGMCVCHTCDNRKCCNPEHLFLGTIEENNKDRASKNRSKNQIGELNDQSKLTAYQVLEIRNLYSKGMSQGKISSKFGVSQTNIGKIIRRVTWKHI